MCLRIMQWNVEGLLNKQLSLVNRIHEEDMDITSIQEIYLNSNLRFSVRSYQVFRKDRGSQK